MTARQEHGFEYERNLFSRFSILPSPSYTSKWDGVLGDTPVSIKTKHMRQNIEMGDLFRNSECEEDFLLFVGFWEGAQKSIREENVLLLPCDIWRSFFDRALVEECRHVFDGITNSREDDGKWKARWRPLKQAWAETGSPIDVHFKRDHKTQKRVQCSIRYASYTQLLLPLYGLSEREVEQLSHTGYLRPRR